MVAKEVWVRIASARLWQKFIEKKERELFWGVDASVFQKINVDENRVTDYAQAERAKPKPQAASRVSDAVVLLDEDLSSLLLREELSLEVLASELARALKPELAGRSGVSDVGWSPISPLPTVTHLPIEGTPSTTTKRSTGPGAKMLGLAGI